jgi:cytochrome c biogenesis protein CcmG, thiol:disulfide interchange protein DsbE
VAALLVGLALLPRLSRSYEAGLVGREAPEFSLAVAANAAALGDNQTRITMSELRGHAVLLDFWATWCGPCRAQSPIVERISRRWRDQGVVVVGVNTDKPDEGDPAAFAQAHGITYPIVHDAMSEVARMYDVESLPTLVVVSRSGRVVAVRSGVTDDAQLERLLRQAL